MNKLRESVIELLKSAPDHIDGHWPELDEVVKALAQPEPTVPDNMQDWAKLDGVDAWQLIERHADNWADIGKMMDEYISAKIAAAQSDSAQQKAVIDMIDGLRIRGNGYGQWNAALDTAILELKEKQCLSICRAQLITHTN